MSGGGQDRSGTKKHLLYWVFEKLEPHQIQMLCGLPREGEAFQERYKAYLDFKKSKEK